MFTLLVWGINICVPVHAQNKLDSLQHLNEVVVTARAVQKEIFRYRNYRASSSISSAHTTWPMPCAIFRHTDQGLRRSRGTENGEYPEYGNQPCRCILRRHRAGKRTKRYGRFGKILARQHGVCHAVQRTEECHFPAGKGFRLVGLHLFADTDASVRGRKKYNVRASFKTGSFGVANPSVLWEQKLGQRISSSFSAEYLHSSGKYKFTYRMQEGYDTTAVRQNGDLNALRVEGGLFGQLKQGYWKAKAYLYNSERGYPGAIVRNKFSHEDRQWDTNFFTQGTFKKDFTQWYSLLANAKYAYDYLHYLADPKKDESLMYVNNHYYQQEVYTSVANRFNLFPWWEASFSADYQFNLLNADLRDFVYPRRHTLLASIATAMRFKQVELQASLLETFVHDTSSGTPAPDKQKLTPSFFVSWRPFPQSGLNLRGFYKRIFRMPTLNDLYYTFIGNINLEPEFTTQYDLGFTYSRTFNNTWLRSLEVQTDVYYNEVENKIVATPTSNFFRWTMVNLGNVEIRGVDVALQTGWKIGRDLTVSNRINYTYQRAQDFTDPKSEFYGGQIPYIPWHSGSAVVNLQWRSWEANYSFIYTGERYSSQANIPYNYQLPWYTSDFSVSKGLKVWKGDLKLTLEVNNLLNQQYEVVICYPMPGTNFKLIAQYNF